MCHDLGIRAHIPSLEETQRGSGRKKGIFAKEAFSYNPDDDTFSCPAGQTLRRRSYNKKRRHYEYKASSDVCAKCQFKERCTRAKDGRTLKRHVRQDELDMMVKIAHSREAKKDIKTRQHLSERSFAQSKRYGYKRARWRRLWRMEIQDFLIAAVQNIMILINHLKDKVQSKANALVEQHRPSLKDKKVSIALIGCLKALLTNIKSACHCLLLLRHLRVIPDSLLF